MFGKYTKAILGTLAAIATWLTTAVADGGISLVELSGLFGAVVSYLVIANSTNTINGVPYQAPNVVVRGEHERL